MKKALFILLALTIFNCSSDDDTTMTPDTPEATILGRWVFVGFDNVIRYEFTETKRFDIYSDNGTFPTLEEFNQQNPLLTGLDWYFDGDKVVVDLNFGNLSILTPQFVCDNYVINWLNDDGEITGTYYRVGFDYTSCN